MTRVWDPTKHPRWLAEAPDSKGGEFRSKAEGWIGRLSTQLRGSEYRPGQWEEADPGELRAEMEQSLRETLEKANDVIRTQRDKSLDAELGSASDQDLREAAFDLFGYHVAGDRQNLIDQVKREVRRQSDQAMAEDDAQITAREIAQIEAPRILFRNGPHFIWVSGDTGEGPWRSRVRDVMEMVDELQTSNPGSGPIRVSIVPGHQMVDVTAQGETLLGTGLMHLNEENYQDYQEALANLPNHFMPSKQNTDFVRYVIVHEWGHVVDTQAARDDAEEYWQRIRGYAGIQNGEVSMYGQTKPREAFAELFAEWYLSGGQTDIPVVQDYAKRYGWKGRKEAK